MSPARRFARASRVCLPCLLVAASAVHAQARPATPAAPAPAAGPTVAQEFYVAARAFELNANEIRAYCKETPALGASVEAAWTTFRQRNPDFVSSLASRPTEPDFVAASQDFDRNVPQISATLRARARQTPAAQLCPAVAEQMRGMKFADLVTEARKRRATQPSHGPGDGHGHPQPAQPAPAKPPARP